MEPEADLDEVEADLEIELVDLTDVTLDELRELDDQPFNHSLRRIIRDSEDVGAVVVAGYDPGLEPQMPQP